MRFSTFIYCLKQGLINIRRNFLHSLASAATISACIFLFCLFFAIIGNVRHFAQSAETTVGITVFFDENYTEEQIWQVGDVIAARPEVREMDFISEEAAWESFQMEYFAGMEELAEGFADDNPLAGSASFEIFLHDISTQEEMVEYLSSLQGVRKVNYSNSVAEGLENMNQMIGMVSILIIAVLLAVAIFLISNTISVAAAFRKSENRIMMLIGATNSIVRAPFLVEGLFRGIVGAAVPLAGIYFLYQKAAEYVMGHYVIMSGIFTPIPIETLFPVRAGTAFALGGGVGFFVSFFTIQKHLKL